MIAVPSYIGFVENAKIKADLVAVGTLNRATPIFRMNNPSFDPFLNPDNSPNTLMQALVTGGYLDSAVEPKAEGAEFIWDTSSKKWLYHSSAAAANPPGPYLLSASDYQLGWGAHVIGNYTNTSEKNIELPEGVVSIKGGQTDAAFLNKGLESVILPSSLVNIYSHAFYQNNLTEIIIPEEVVFIGTMSFYNNPITRITINSTPGQVVIQDRVFGSGYTEAKIITDSFKAADRKSVV